MQLLTKPAARERTILALIILVVLFAHIASFTYLSVISAQNPDVPAYPIVPGDSLSYVQYADTLLEHGVFADAPALTPQRMWPPGYPAFLAAVKSITGSFTPAIVIQTALAVLASLIVYAIARRFVPAWLAAIAALIFGLDPMYVFSNTTLMSDGLFTSTIVVAVYLAFYARREHLFLRWGIVGVLLASATMMRAIGQYLVVIIPAAYIMQALFARERRMRRELSALIVYFVVVAMILTPWIMRNEAIFGKAEIAHGGAGNLMFWYVRDFLAWREMEKTRPTSVFYPARHLDAPEFAAVDRTIKEAFARIVPPGERADNYDGTVAVRFILADPLHYSQFHLAHLAPYFLSGSASAYRQIVYQQRDNTGFTSSTLNAVKEALANPRDRNALLFALPVVLESGALLLLTLLALWGLIVKWRRFEVILFAGLVGYFAVLTGPLAMARYRVPAAPFIVLLAAIGAYAILSRMHRWKSAPDSGSTSAPTSARVTLSDVSVVIPCYNEQHSIKPVIDAVPKGVLEIILVDNNSTDESMRVARECGARVVQETTQGYGAALKCGFREAKGAIIASFDADNQYPAEEIPRILDFLNTNNLDFVSASRFPLTEKASMSLVRRVGNWGPTLAANVLFLLSLTDSQSGMWVFKRSALGRILPKSDDMPLSQELKIRAALDPSIRFAEYHIPYRVRIGESKLFPFRHGVKLLLSLLVLRLRR